MAWADQQRVKRAAFWRSGAVREAPEGHGWRWQPDLWRAALGEEIAPDSPYTLAPHVELFHDGKAGEVTAHGMLPDRAETYELGLETRGFSGSFLSVAVSLPRAMPSPAQHVITVDAQVAGPSDGQGYLRINQQVGANAWSVTQGLPTMDRPTPLPFDLRDAPDPGGRFWVDVILEPASDTVFCLRHVTVAAHLHPIF